MECYSVTHVYREFRFFWGFAFRKCPLQATSQRQWSCKWISTTVAVWNAWIFRKKNTSQWWISNSKTSTSDQWRVAKHHWRSMDIFFNAPKVPLNGGKYERQRFTAGHFLQFDWKLQANSNRPTRGNQVKMRDWKQRNAWLAYWLGRGFTCFKSP